MVQRKPNPGEHVARWMRETGRKLQEGRRARKSGRDRAHAAGTGRTRRRVPAPPPGWLRWCLAWCVHAYTAMGLVVAAAIALLIVRGGDSAFQTCFALMVLATVIDATDGTFARKVGVQQVLPGFDGRRLDDITDFLTYSFLPLLLVWRAGVLPQGWEGWLILPLLASAYGFCQASIKTDDGYFLGFPSLWNVVAFYVYALRFDGWVSLALMIVLGVLTFVPSRYLYPSQPGRLNRWSTILGGVWGGMLIFLVWRMPALQPGGDAVVWAIAWVSLIYPIYYFAASWVVTLRFWRGRRASLG